MMANFCIICSVFEVSLKQIVNSTLELTIFPFFSVSEKEKVSKPAVYYDMYKHDVRAQHKNPSKALELFLEKIIYFKIENIYRAGDYAILIIMVLI